MRIEIDSDIEVARSKVDRKSWRMGFFDAIAYIYERDNHVKVCYDAEKYFFGDTGTDKNNKEADDEREQHSGDSNPIERSI